MCARVCARACWCECWCVSRSSKHPSTQSKAAQKQLGGGEVMDERQFMERADFLGVDFPPLYMCKSKRGIKREDGGKDAYKLPHRLIEKKRRDRINECIGQLKDLLPENLKLSTLGHLEKAVVLELTLKHLNALTAVTEQQHQKILALQNGDRCVKPPVHADLDAFHSGFQTCAKEVLQYLSQSENWAAREQRCAQLVSHLHTALAQFQPDAPPQQQQQQQQQQQLAAAGDAQKPDGQANCVPVIQRTQGGELNETDTDTDSGYGGEAEKSDGQERECARKAAGARAVKVKQEFGDERAAKKTKTCWSGSGPGGAEHSRPDVAFMNSLLGMNSVGQQVCMPFYFINPSAAAPFLPFLDKSHLEKFMYPAAALASPFPWLYPAHAAAAAAAAFPGLSARLGAPPQPEDSGAHEADAGSAEELEEESPVSDGEGDASPQLNSPAHAQFTACQSS